MRGVYVVTMDAVSVSGAISLIQLKAGSAAGLEIISASIAQSGSTTSAMQRVQILRKSAAATVTTFTPILLNPNDAAAKAVGGTSATGTNASAEGTDSDILVDDCFNVLNGWSYIPVPEERIQVAPAGICALKFPAAPGSALVITARVCFRELE